MHSIKNLVGTRRHRKGEILGIKPGQVPGVLCDKSIFRETQHTCLLNQDRDHKTDPIIDTTKVQPVDNEF